MRAPAAVSDSLVGVVSVNTLPSPASVAWVLPSCRMVALSSAPARERLGRGRWVCQLAGEAPTEAAIPLMIPLSSLSELSRESIRVEVLSSSLFTEPMRSWIASEFVVSSLAIAAERASAAANLIFVASCSSLKGVLPCLGGVFRVRFPRFRMGLDWPLVGPSSGVLTSHWLFPTP